MFKAKLMGGDGHEVQVRAACGGSCGDVIFGCLWWDDFVPESDAGTNLDTVGVLFGVFGDCHTGSR